MSSHPPLTNAGAPAPRPTQHPINPALDAATWDEFAAHLPASPEANEA